jgi:small subunit ribosomal protein S6e
MPFKLNISDKGRAWKFETESESFVGKQVGERIEGKDVESKFEGYEFEITGGSDNAGFPLKRDVEGIQLKRVLLAKGWGMKDNTGGMRRRKTVRGKQIAGTTSQINMKVTKHGSKKLQEMFPEQNQPKPKKAEAVAVAPSA